MSWLEDGGSGSEVDVVALMDSEVSSLIGRAVAAGALLSVGRTSDGGAVGITVTLDGEWKRGYFRSTEDAIDWLTPGVEWLEAEAPRRAASTAQGKRKRRS